MYGPSRGQRLASGSASIAIVALVGLLLARSLSMSVLRFAEPVTLVTLAPDMPRPEKVKPPEPHAARKAKKNEAPTGGALPAPAAITIPNPAPFLPSAMVIFSPAVIASGGGTNGTGAAMGRGLGDSGEGEGNGDGEGMERETPPRHLKGKLFFADLPPSLRADGISRTVAVRYAVAISGHVENCTVTASSGDAKLDALSCQLIERRFRFSPSRDETGQPVRAIIEEQHSWRTIHVPGTG